MRLYNTLSKKIEEFVPINPPEVGMYSCGPTVYEHTHIGHMRTYVNTDVLRAALAYNNFRVKQVMNITDVGHLYGDQDMGEDKIEEAARKRKKTAWEIASEYEKEFWQVMKLLNIQKPEIVAKATEHIKEMISFIKKIEKNGFTYKTSDGIYFDTSKLSNYGILANVSLEKLKEGARVEKNPEKKNPTDFALWKFSVPPTGGSAGGKKRQMEWDSPWAPPGVRLPRGGKFKGFPGWHIECSAMSTKYLGEVFDIHTGGEDHINVHHTNEIAQSQAAYGKIPARFWFHNTFLMVEGKKMSRSLGNFITASDIKKKGFEVISARYLFLTAHYRSRLNFTWQALEAAENALKRLRELVASWQEEGGRKVASREDLAKIESLSNDFDRAVNNDLDIPRALAVLWQVAKSNIPDPDKKDLVLKFDQVLRLNLGAVSPIKVPEEIEELAKKREMLRGKGEWQKADKLRKQIEEKGFLLEDTSQGPKVKRKR